MSAPTTGGIAGYSPVQINVDELAEKYDPTPNPFITDPHGWAKKKLNEDWWSKQVEIGQSVVENRYTVVQSCHDVGKSYVASRLAAWWLDVHPMGEAFVVTTAPSERQVYAILWREIRRAHKSGNLSGRTTLDAQWYMGDDELVAYGRKPADYQHYAFQGIHARYVLVIMDEACGIPKALYDAVDSIVTNEHSRVLAIGNPDDPASEMASVCKPGSGWHKIHIGYKDSPAFTGEEVDPNLLDLMIGRTWVEERKKRWKVGSPLYTSKVEGLFPDVSDDTLITPGMIRKGQENDLSASRAKGSYGMDVARYGSDETCIYRDRGGCVRGVYWGSKQDTTETTGAAVNVLKPHGGAVPMQIDVGGLGAGVYDNCNEQGLPVHPFNFGSAPFDTGRFVNRRAEAYWEFREDLESGEIDLPPEGEDDDLINQLQSVKWKVNSKGKILLESKEEMKKRRMPSPDRADAAVMARSKGVIWEVPGDEGNAPANSKGETGDLNDKKW